MGAVVGGSHRPVSSKYADQMRWRTPLLAVIGSVLVIVGTALMTWEVDLFRATTFDRDFTGLSAERLWITPAGRLVRLVTVR